MMKKIVSLAVAIILCVCIGTAAFATDNSLCSVNYTNASQFIFNPNGGDLFKNFKGVMPGDELSQDIVIANQLATRTVTIYLRAKIDESYKDFLDNIEIEVSLNKHDLGEKILAKNKASEAGNLEKNVCLGTYAPGEQGELKVKIKVDKNMGNEFKNAVGVIEWIFSAEEGEEPTTEEPTTKELTPKPPVTEKPSKPTPSPDTGSNDKIGAVLGIVAGIAGLIAIVLVFGKKKGSRKYDQPVEVDFVDVQNDDD